MLRISKKADYAVFLLGAIARQGAFPGGSAADSVVSAHEIARLAGLNKSVVANLLKDFARDGLLDSVRGLRGGYRLNRAPAEISLGQILEVVEGRFALVDCVGHGAAHAGKAGKTAPAQATARNSGPADGDPESAPRTEACALISFCPSKQPMRIVHERISRLFDEIHLDELCSMTPVCPSSQVAQEPRVAGTTHQVSPITNGASPIANGASPRATARTNHR